MLTATFTDIHRESRVVHQTHGRGEVALVYWTERRASVLFDDDAALVEGPLKGKVARRVWLRDLTPEPLGMPAVVASEPRPFRFVWPRRETFDAPAGQGDGA